MLLNKKFFDKDTVKVAKALLGKIIRYKNCSGMIVETEAYKGFPDKASHAAKRTKRSAIMFDTYGTFYIYFVYGNYFCMNITTEKAKPGAVLIRALEPLNGIKTMAKRRGIKTKRTDNKALLTLTNGPGKLCRAFAITKKLNNTKINDKIKIIDNKKKFDIVQTTRIGIEKAKHLPWRFYIKDNKFVSKK